MRVNTHSGHFHRREVSEALYAHSFAKKMKLKYGKKVLTFVVFHSMDFMIQSIVDAWRIHDSMFFFQNGYFFDLLCHFQTLFADTLPFATRCS